MEGPKRHKTKKNGEFFPLTKDEKYQPCWPWPNSDVRAHDDVPGTHK